MQTLQERVRELIIDIPNFPIEGIIFKDILPLFRNPNLVKELVLEMAKELQSHRPTALVAMESRGFLLGMPLALELGIPFICIRKKGKLPGNVSGLSYSLEYGQAEIEIQTVTRIAVKTFSHLITGSIVPIYIPKVGGLSSGLRKGRSCDGAKPCYIAPLPIPLINTSATNPLCL